MFGKLRLSTRSGFILAIAAALLLAAAASLWYMKQSTRLVNNHPAQKPLEVRSEVSIADTYDVIVAGTDPEGIAAALSAARSGMQVLLVDGKNRELLGGLMTIGWLNTLDFNYSPKQPLLSRILRKPEFLNKGIFQEWYDQIEGSSFDTISAANAFYRMVSSEPGIHLLMNVQSMEPIVERQAAGNAVTGMRLVKSDGTVSDIQAKSVIDATQDGDIAAAAGAPYTIGREDIGDKNARMAATLVFRLSGVTQDVWERMGEHLDTGIDRMSIWGYNEAREYVPSDPSKVKIRGLNIGRQNDETILINAMQLFDIDPLDPESVRQGIEIGRREAPLITAFLKERFEAFKDVEFAGTASELYIRESRHIKGEYRLKLADVMENRDHWDAIAYGSYSIDIQSTSNGQVGTILMSPLQYGVPFRCLVPLEVDGLLVVGRAASFDTLPHGSARVIPLGMATGEAAGAAAKLALERQVTFRELSRSEKLIAELRQRLTEQGMELKMLRFAKPDYMEHKDYKGLLTAASMYLTSGSYSNDAWDLDGSTNVQRFINTMRRVRSMHPDRFPTDPAIAVKGLEKPGQQPLSLPLAAYIISVAAGAADSADEAMQELLRLGWLTEQTLDTIENPDNLTNGDTFMLVRDLAAYYLGIRYD
ncbi:FAD-dependent oxidoreductase [Paenibacillus tarimensis]